GRGGVRERPRPGARAARRRGRLDRGPGGRAARPPRDRARRPHACLRERRPRLARPAARGGAAPPARVRAGRAPGPPARREPPRLVHAERLAVLATGAEEGLYSGEGAAIEVLGRALVAVREAAGLDASLGPVRALLEGALAELEEAGQSLARYARELTPDASRLEAVEERLAQLARLKRKFAGPVGERIRR